MADLHGMTLQDLEAWAHARGATPGAARLLARHALARQASVAPPQDQGPSRALLAAAEAELSSALPPAASTIDPDGTVRFAVRLDAGAVIETVAIFQPASEVPAPGGRKTARWTLCVSSQAGCARGCTFCETGRLGLVRNLSAAEIVQQVALATRFLAARGEERPRNVVFMGMGEPLDNLDSVVRAIDVLRERGGFAIPERRITVSTVGIVPRMDELYARTRANVAVSLHALDEETRRSLLPVARRWTLGELRAAIARSPRTVLLQWTLIEGVNDSDRDAVALAAFCAGLEVRVNLIPLNPGPLAAQRAPSLGRCRAFQRRLAEEGVRTLLRMPHGLAVGGACGQLAGALRMNA
ncbi:MAG: 23S rRNA (adenine(2503)-C(2))-methyltransferase RlmN [Myxococcales bacterium]